MHIKKENLLNKRVNTMKFSYLLLILILITIVGCNSEKCGDSICDTREAIFGSCPNDCGLCRGLESGCDQSGLACCDGLKESHLSYKNGEICSSVGCGTVCIPCGNGVCDANENNCNCPVDCKDLYCNDYDGGLNYYVAAKTCVADECKEDYSLKCKDFPCKIKEFYCKRGEINNKTKICNNGRMNNTCLKTSPLYKKGQICKSNTSIEDCMSVIWELNDNTIRINKIDTEKKDFDIKIVESNKTYKNINYNGKEISILLENIGEIIVIINEEDKSIQIKGTADMVCSDSDSGTDIFTKGTTSLYKNNQEDNCINHISTDLIKNYLVTSTADSNLLVTSENIIGKKIKVSNKVFTIVNTLKDDSGKIDFLYVIEEENKLILTEGYKTNTMFDGNSHTMELLEINTKESMCEIKLDNKIAWINKEKCYNFEEKKICVSKPEKGFSRNQDKDKCEVYIGTNEGTITNGIMEFYCEQDSIKNKEFLCINDCKNGSCKKEGSPCKSNYFNINDNYDNESFDLENIGKEVYDNGNIVLISGTVNNSFSNIIGITSPSTFWINENEEKAFERNGTKYLLSITKIRELSNNLETEIRINQDNIKLNRTNCMEYGSKLIICLPKIIERNSKEKIKVVNLLVGELSKITKYNNPKLTKIC